MPSRRTIVSIGALAGLFLAGCTQVPPGAADRAEEEGRAEARAEGFRQIRADAASTRIGDKVLVRREAVPDGREYRGTCTYDRSSRRVRLDMERADGDDSRLVERAREACREEAVDRGYEVRGTSEVRRIGDTVRPNLELRRRGRSYEGYCRYEGHRADLEIR